jgi:hypothetical protein
MSNLTNLELLKLATELAYADYNNRRANLHNKWLIDNECMKKIYGTTVPYPPIPPYPTEEEIVAKAKTLIEFLSVPRPDVEQHETQLAVKQLITEVTENKEEKTNIIPESIEKPATIKKVKKDRDIVIEEKPTPNNIPAEQIDTDKSSVIDKIKKVWR